MARTAAVNFTGPLQFPYATAATDLFKKEDVQTLAVAVDTHDHSSGKGLPLAAAAIPNGLITSAMIADGTIQAVDIAANAIHQAAFVGGSTSGPTTTSTTFVDLTDMTINLTTFGGDVYVTLVACVSNTALANAVSIAINRDGSDLDSVTMSAPGAGYVTCLTTIASFPALAAGAHVFKGRWNVSGSTGTAAGVQRYLQVLELFR